MIPVELDDLLEQMVQEGEYGGGCGYHIWEGGNKIDSIRRINEEGGFM